LKRYLKLRFKNNKLKCPSQFYERGMKYWAKENQILVREISRLKEENKLLKEELVNGIRN
jgi:hypothetical protein